MLSGHTTVKHSWKAYKSEVEDEQCTQNNFSWISQESKEIFGGKLGKGALLSNEV